MTKFLAKILILFIFTLLLSKNLSSEEIILPKIQPKTDKLLKEPLLLPKIKPKIDELTKLKIQQKRFLLPKKKPVTTKKDDSKILTEEKITSKKKIITTHDGSKLIFPKKNRLYIRSKLRKLQKNQSIFQKMILN